MNEERSGNCDTGLPNKIEAPFLLNKVLEDNKTIAKELEIQLAFVETLQRENIALSNTLEKARREGMLNHRRDELNMKRNVSLIRENKFLRERLDALSIQKEKLISEFNLSRNQMKGDFSKERENLKWKIEHLEIEIATACSKSKAMEKTCKQLRDKIRIVHGNSLEDI